MESGVKALSLPVGEDTHKAISVYFLAGIGTWESGDMFKDAEENIIKKYQDLEYDNIHVATVYPYGTMEHCHCENSNFMQTVYVASQASMVKLDMDLPYDNTIGGNNAFEAIKYDYKKMEMEL